LRWIRIGSALACAGLAAGPVLAASETKFRLVVTGSTFVNFEGDCTLVDRRGFEVPSRIIGSVPQAYGIYAEAVSCEIRNSDVTGSLSARLERDGKVIARASTEASLGEVTVRSEGPWGGASASVEVIPLLPHHRLAPSRPSGVMPIHPPIVPPLRGQSVPPLR
jgi:hypothetical protein